MSTVISKIYPAPPLNEKEALRYAGCRTADAGLTALLHECVSEAWDKFSYKLCWCELPLSIAGDSCDMGVLHLRSGDLAMNLCGCDRVILFAATVGVGIDRLVAKYSRLSPAKAVLLQGLGAERIEALCDAFCADIAKQYAVKTHPRFSPGYGDLPLSAQSELFRLLDCPRLMGLTLNDSMLMSPTKSVTAFVGLERV